MKDVMQQIKQMHSLHCNFWNLAIKGKNTKVKV